MTKSNKSSKSSRHKRSRPRPVMNVTPLVDVVLVLLIIFMVVIPALQQGLQLEYAGVANVDPKDEKKREPWNVSVDQNGELYIEEQKLPFSQAEARLKELARKAPGRRIVLHGDKRAPYKKVRDVYRIAQQVGFPGVSLRVNHRAEDQLQASR